jgi:hypothetical protein
VLKPGAEFHFAEHGLAPDAMVARTQDRWTPVQKKLAGGCHLNRDIGALLEGAGLVVEQVENFFLEGGPKAWSYMYLGRARRP